MTPIKPGVLVMLKPTPNRAHNAHCGEVRTVQGRGRHDWLLEGIEWLEWSERYLIVLGNPGPDAVDETLLLIPSPGRQHERDT